MELNVTECECVDCIQLAENTVQFRAIMITFGFHKGLEIF
jgi:hypothetical protein